ncbi:MAG: hypothetical protein AB8G11_23080 [Saprospiraceae bacterium]
MSSVLSCSYRLLAKACTKQKNEQTNKLSNIITLQENIQLTIVDNINACKDWSAISRNQSLFLQQSYLKAIESCPPKDMQFAYLTFYKNNQPCGIAYAQIFKFSTYESLKHHRSFNDEKAKFLRLKKWAARKIEFYSIVCGNVLMTGEYGYAFDNELIKKEEQFEIVNEGLDALRNNLKQKNINAPVILYKDYFENNRQDIENTNFGEFQIQPNMVIDLEEDWEKFEDYLAAMSSKYRVRAKRAFKKAKNIEKEELDLEEVRMHQVKMYELYRGVVVSAGFNGITLQQNYFTNLKEHLGDKFKVIGYFKEGELIGFYTVFLEKERNSIESHFLGIDHQENRNCQLYLNMLYDMIRMGVYHQIKRIYLARTALEIKSSVGAKPYDMYFYMQHKNPMFNALTKQTFDLFNPQEEWTQRKPFKA